MSACPTTLTKVDLHALLDRDFRRRTRACRKCEFSLPYRVFGTGRDPGNWAVIPSEACSHFCEMILDDLIAKYRSRYRLSDTGRFHSIGA
jgi:hypothetical protein